ncbi:MAG: 2-oxoacid:ferredoxin oxidoreductase subunit gamma [Firmicutes bacterium]|nr:2-oxoacid:ferredoxin oxidoreductase subunit gamma [Bacillota bacterium]
MKQEVIVAGFGGQGVLLLGQVLAYAGMVEGKEVSWLPSYGPEMRGGTANCTVVLSDTEIGSPVVSQPSCVIALNLPSMEKFEPMLKPGGLLIINSSLIEKKAERDDIEVVKVAATEIANELGSGRVANMVALGAFVQQTGAVDFATLEEALKEVLPQRRHDLIPLNLQAIQRGAVEAE